MVVENLFALWLRLKTLLRRRKLDRDLEEELSFHLAMRQQSSEDATPALAARRQFGNVTRIQEACRELWTFPRLETIWHDVRYAARMLRKNPVFGAVAILSLALGIGANTALFSLMDVMLFRALPVKNPQELVEFIRLTPNGSMMSNLPYTVFTRFEQDRNVLAGVFAVWPRDLAFRGAGATDRANVHFVSGAFFPALGVNPILGRAITPDDDRAGAENHVAVLSYRFWTRRLGSDPAILGTTVHLSGQAFTVIGVMPEEFFGIDRARRPDLWIPMSAGPRLSQVWVLARLKPNVSPAQAGLQLDPLFRLALGDLRGWDRKAVLSQSLLVNSAAHGTSGLRWKYWDRSGALKILLALTGMILLIACVNLANLLMARSAARSREFNIRLAIGAGRWRIMRQMITENLLLSFCGGALGFLFAAWGHRLIIGFLIRDLDSVALDFRLDYRLLGAGLLLSILTSLMFGLAPAIRIGDIRRSSSAIHADNLQTRSASIPFAKSLLLVQIVLSVVLLVGAGLSVRSLKNLAAADLGFKVDNLMLIDVSPVAEAPEVRQRFWTRLSDNVSRLPGVESAALAGDAVFGNGGWNQSIWLERPGRPPQEVGVSDNYVSNNFFATAGIPVLAGREFGEQDRENAPLAALVSQTFARRFFGDVNPIGKRFGDLGPDSSARFTIVGVVGDTKYGTVRENMRAMVFHPLAQEKPMASLVLHIRCVSPPAAVVPSIRREILALDREALIAEVRTLPQEIHTQLQQDRMFATLASFFAVLAMVLGMIGIYGIVAYRVTNRTAEIGIRLALGAHRRGVVWLIMRETVLLLAAGTLIGIPAALVSARLIKSVLYGLAPSDPVSLTCAALALFAAGGIASFLPARRAASIEPVAALRNE